MASSSSRKISLSPSSCGPYTAVSHQLSCASPVAERGFTAMVTEKQPIRTSVKATSLHCQATRIPPRVLEAGKYANSLKLTPSKENTVDCGITSSFVSCRQTIVGRMSPTRVRTQSHQALALRPRTFHDKIVVLSIGDYDCAFEGRTRPWQPRAASLFSQPTSWRPGTTRQAQRRGSQRGWNRRSQMIVATPVAEQTAA